MVADSPVPTGLLDRVRAVLGERLVAVHRTDDGTGDRALVVVTAGRAGSEVLDVLLADGPVDVDTWLVDRADLRSPMTLGRRWPVLRAGAPEVGSSAAANTAAARWVLRERGVALHGPGPRELVAEVGPEALRAEALGAARARAEELEDDPAAYADLRGLAEVVLTACGTARTAADAVVDPRVEAGRWALVHLDAVHAPVVRTALAERDRPTGRDSTPAEVTAARALVWDVVRVAGTLALEARGSL